MKEPRLSNDAKAIVTAIDRFSANTGKWLAAIALAASTPTDNSAQVQAHIDRLTNEVKQQADAVEAAANHAKET
mgnify:CR=1 FL=1